MKKLNDILTGKKSGLYYGNRILLPFRVEILKIVIEHDILMNFSKKSKEASYEIKENYTEIYLHNFSDLQSISSKYEMLKFVVVKEGDDIFNFENHIRISAIPEDNHSLKIDDLDEDILFIE